MARSPGGSGAVWETVREEIRLREAIDTECEEMCRREGLPLGDTSVPPGSQAAQAQMMREMARYKVREVAANIVRNRENRWGAGSR